MSEPRCISEVHFAKSCAETVQESRLRSVSCPLVKYSSMASQSDAHSEARVLALKEIPTKDRTAHKRKLNMDFEPDLRLPELE